MRSITQDPLRAPRIAIVDDEQCVRVGLRRLCVALGMDASVYASGHAFLDSLAASVVVDCVLLDTHMPGMTGLEVQHNLAALGNRVPVIVVTADDAPDARARCIAAGAAAFLRKPIGSDELSSAVEALTGWWLAPRGRIIR